MEVATQALRGGAGKGHGLEDGIVHIKLEKPKDMMTRKDNINCPEKYKKY